MDRIDILLATYNGEKYLRDQIDSILNQTYADFNLIISDDASTDDTVKILEEYKKKDSRITVYNQEENIGSTNNFEFLLTKVQNDYYMLSDQDDIWEKEKIEKSVKKIKETNADLVFSDLAVVDENLNIINESFCKLKNIYSKIKKDVNYEALYLNNYVTGCTILSKKEYINKILPIPKDVKYLIHDYWIAIVVSQNGKLEFIDEPLVKYRQHGNNQVGTAQRTEKMNSIEDIRNLFLEVKIEHFNVFNQKRELFSESKQELNKKALEYYKRLKSVKNINFKDLSIFNKLYKYENKKYFILNFIILNMPCIARVLYKVKRGVRHDRTEN